MDWQGTTFEADRTVEIAVIKVEATVPVTDPTYGGAVVLNPGGPGGSGVDEILNGGHHVRTILSAGAHADRDSAKVIRVHHSLCCCANTDRTSTSSVSTREPLTTPGLSSLAFQIIQLLQLITSPRRPMAGSILPTSRSTISGLAREQWLKVAAEELIVMGSLSISLRLLLRETSSRFSSGMVNGERKRQKDSVS